MDVRIPEVVAVRGGKVTVQLQTASEINGPLSHYDLVVVPTDSAARRTQDYTLKELEVRFTVQWFRRLA